MSYRLVYAVCVGSILSLAVVVRLADPLPIARLRLIQFDGFQKLAPRAFSSDLPIRIVDIDERSLGDIGQWPWPRRILADLVSRLQVLGAAVVAFDFILPEKERSIADEIRAALADQAVADEIIGRLGGVADNDVLLAQAIGEQRTVLGLMGSASVGSTVAQEKAAFAYAGDDPSLFVPQFDGVIASLPVLQGPAGGAGVLNWVPEYDQIVRKVPTVMRLGGRLYPSLAVEVLRVAQGASTVIVRASNSSHDFAFGLQTGITRIKVGEFEVPTDASGQLWLHFTRHAGERFVSARDVLKGDVARGEIEGRIVLIGSSAAGILDLRSTPLDAAMAGVEVHAQAIEQILSGRHLVRPDYTEGLEIATLIVFGGLLALVVNVAGATAGAVVGGAVVATLVGGAWYAFSAHGLLVDASYPTMTATLVYLFGTAFSFFVTERERNRIRQVFGHYMAPSLIAKLLAEPGRLRLGGETRELTLLFSDVRDFTSIAETYMSDPEGLTQLMNQLLTPLSRAIIERDGVIDKYIGDAIMAFWNAPLDDPVHPYHACTTALEMVRRLEALNEARRLVAAQQGIAHRPINLGIGIATGEGVIGNMGSDIRFDYSVLGDVVNLASRLEGLSSYYGVRILAASSTIARVEGDLATIEIDVVQVKGRQTPEPVHAILGDGARATEPDFVALKQAMMAIVTHYRAQRWDAARAAIAETRAIGASDALAGVLAVYEQRIVVFETSPPGAEWSGVWRATEK